MKGSRSTPGKRFDPWLAIASFVYFGGVIGGALYLCWRIWNDHCS